MKLRNRIFLPGALFLFTLIFCGRGAASLQDLGDVPTRVELGKGVIADAVKKDSEAERAGLQVGDILLSWTRDGSKGEVESPFDLPLIEVEQAPRGAVTIEGLRGTEKRAWVLGPGSWGIHVRPNVPESLYVEGQKLIAAAKIQDAVQYWRSAAQAVQGSQPSWLAPWFLYHTGELLADARQWKEADALFQEAIERSASESATKVLLLRAWAATFQQRDDWENVRKYYQAAADASPKSNSESLLFADTLDGLGLGAWQRGDLVEAEKNYPRALEIQQRLAPSSLATAKSINGLGLIAWGRGDLAGAENYDSEALSIREKLAPGSLDVATSLNNLGILAMDRGDLVKADELYLQALTIIGKLIPGGMEGARTLGNLGIVADMRGDVAKARDYYERALAIQEKLAPGSLSVARTLNNLAIVEDDQGDSAAAEDCLHRALAIRERLAPGGMELAGTLNNLGMLSRKRSDLAKAEEYLGRSLALKEKTAPGGLYVAAGLNQLGDLARDRGDLAKAEEYYRRGLPIWEALAPEKKGFAETLASLAGVMLRQGQLDAAAPLFERALNVLEGQMSRLGGSEDVRAGFRASHLSYYHDYIDLLMRQKQPEKALEALERSRAQSLLELLAAAHVDVRKGVDVALLERERSLAADIAAKTNRRIRLMSEKHTQEQVAAINQEIEKLLAEHKDVEGQIRVSSPGYTALTQPQPLRAKEVQEQLLDADTLLLEYSLGEERSYVWAVTPESLAAYELPKQKDIEDAAEKVYQLLTAQNRIIAQETEPRRRTRLAEAEREYPQAAAALSGLVLGPVTAQVKGKRRLVIVSDGALQYVPFAALPEPSDSKMGSFPIRPPLVVEHEIVNLPSASVLAVLRRERMGRTEAAKAVVVLADPVFDDKDRRLKQAELHEQRESQGAIRGSAGKDDASAFELTRSATDLGLSTNGRIVFSRLPWTRREADDILAVTPAGQGKKLLDFAANHAAATDPALAEYRIVHFATHGLLDGKNPELSGLVLSLVDERGRPRDGFLGLRDIYNLNLPVELVVLSGCQTGLGKEMQGEGLIGLTRGFMYAGASRVVASLWNVSDVATAELMAHFYRGMEEKGMPPAAALRSAQIKMWKQRIWRSPYFWAAFQIQGEWK